MLLIRFTFLSSFVNFEFIVVLLLISLKGNFRLFDKENKEPQGKFEAVIEFHKNSFFTEHLN